MDSLNNLSKRQTSCITRLNKSIQFSLDPYMILKNQRIKEKFSGLSRNNHLFLNNKTEQNKINRPMNNINLNNLFRTSNHLKINFPSEKSNLYKNVTRNLIKKNNRIIIKAFSPKEREKPLKDSFFILKHNHKYFQDMRHKNFTFPNKDQTIKFLLLKLKKQSKSPNSNDRTYAISTLKARNPILKEICLINKYKKYKNNASFQNNSLFAYSNNFFQGNSFISIN